jgi:hypothetical protein
MRWSAQGEGGEIRGVSGRGQRQGKRVGGVVRPGGKCSKATASLCAGDGLTRRPDGAHR